MSQESSAFRKEFEQLREAHARGELTPAAASRMRTLGAVCSPLDDALVEHLPVRFEHGPNGTIGIVEEGGVELCRFTVTETEANTELRLCEGASHVHVLALHRVLTPAGGLREELTFRFRRREAFPEDSDGFAYSLAAAAAEDLVFLKGTTPQLFFNACLKPGKPRKVSVELLGLSNLAGFAIAEWRFWDKDFDLVNPIDRKSGKELPVLPRLIEFTPVAGRKLTRQLRELVHRFFDANPTSRDLVGCHFVSRIPGALDRGVWVELRVRPLSPVEKISGSTSIESIGCTPVSVDCYTVERPKGDFGWSSQSVTQSDGWMLSGTQRQQVIDEHVTKPMKKARPQFPECPDHGSAVQETYISLIRECGRGEPRSVHTGDHDKQQATLKKTIWRERVEIARTKGVVSRPKSVSRHRESDVENSQDRRASDSNVPRIFGLDMAEGDAFVMPEFPSNLLLHDVEQALRRIEPRKVIRVIFWHGCWEREGGGKVTLDELSQTFGIGRQKIWHAIGSINRQLAGII